MNKDSQKSEEKLSKPILPPIRNQMWKRNYNKYGIKHVALDCSTPFHPKKYFHPQRQRFDRLCKQNWRNSYYHHNYPTNHPYQPYWEKYSWQKYPYQVNLAPAPTAPQNMFRQPLLPSGQFHPSPHTHNQPPLIHHQPIQPLLNQSIPNEPIPNQYHLLNFTYEKGVPLLPWDRKEKKSKSKSLALEKNKRSRSNSLDSHCSRPNNNLYEDSSNNVTDILEQIIRLNKKCVEDIEKKEAELKEQEEKEEKMKEAFYLRDYDEIIDKKINSLDDLIDLGKMYDPKSDKKYNINLKILDKMVEPLSELKNMIGMNNLKENIVDLILYYLQDFELKNKNMLHTTIQGEPGTGKTEFSKILARIFLKMGVLKSDFFKVVKRSDLIGKYLGSTAIKTQEVIDEVKEKGGVLFIDEAYSLGNDQQKDHFSKECIDTLNQNLTEEKCNFICIIAGYKNELKSSFFSYNPGLERRFPFRFTIDPYKPEELRMIYLKMIEKDDWKIKSEEDIELEFFIKNKDYFKFNGGDMETLFHFTKVVHARRVFCLPKEQKKIIIKEDLKKALQMFLQNDEVKKRISDLSNNRMYL